MFFFIRFYVRRKIIYWISMAMYHKIFEKRQESSIFSIYIAIHFPVVLFHFPIYFPASNAVAVFIRSFWDEVYALLCYALLYFFVFFSPLIWFSLKYVPFFSHRIWWMWIRKVCVPWNMMKKKIQKHRPASRTNKKNRTSKRNLSHAKTFQ